MKQKPIRSSTHQQLTVTGKSGTGGSYRSRHEKQAGKDKHAWRRGETE